MRIAAANGVVSRLAWTCLGTLVVAMMIAGCGGTGGPDLATVTGTVTQNGEPVPEADVMFIPEDGAPSSGKTDASGHFELTFNDGRPGAVPGKHQVVITLPGTEMPEPTGEEEMPAEVKPPVEIRKEAEVEPGENDFTFELGP